MVTTFVLREPGVQHTIRAGGVKVAEIAVTVTVAYNLRLPNAIRDTYSVGSGAQRMSQQFAERKRHAEGMDTTIPSHTLDTSAVPCAIAVPNEPA
jgi:hypothetical protein